MRVVIVSLALFALLFACKQAPQSAGTAGGNANTNSPISNQKPSQPDRQGGITPGVKPPTYLSIEGIDSCLGRFNSGSGVEYRCMSSSKPPACSETSWQQILRDPIAKQLCPNDPQFTDCLHAEVNENGNGYLCAPQGKPEKCPENSWTLLADTLIPTVSPCP